MNTSDFTAELLEMYAFIKDAYNEQDGNLLSSRITVLNSYLARSAEMLAEAEHYLNTAKGLHSELIPQGMPASIAKEWLSGKCANELKLLKLTDRLNAAIVHIIEGTRSQISYCKSVAPRI